MPNAPRAASLLILVGALSLSACSGSSSTRDMYRGQSAAPEVAAPKPVVRKPATAQRLAAVRSLGLDQQARPQKMIGLTSTHIRRALGDPEFVRKDLGVQIWQYRGRECILDLFLYQELGSGLVVRHTELRGSQLNGTGELSCFQNMLIGQS